MDTASLALELGIPYQRALAIMTLPNFPAIKIGKQLHTTRSLLNSWIKHHSGESFSDKAKPERRKRQTNRHQNKGIKTQMKYVGGYEQ